MRKQPSNVLVFVFVFVFIFVFVSCSKEDTYVPSYRTDLVTAITNKDSIITNIVLDNGKRYAISSQKIQANVANSKVRCYTKFSIADDSINANIYEMKRISCYAPLPVDSFKIHPQEPINVTSVWKSGGYINMCLAPLATGMKAFQYDLCIDSVKGRTLHTSLLFKHKGNIQAYTYTFYHSIPLDHNYYSTPFDSLYIYINTYEGMKVWKF